MREYRAKRKDNGEWVYGWYVNIFFREGKFNCPMIIPNGGRWEDKIEVDPATVSQGSGKFDIDNKEVFAGDKSKGHGTCVFTTDGIEGTAGFYWKDKEGLHHYEYLTTPVKIIGNIHSENQDGNES